MAWRWRRTSLGGEADRAAFRALHNASLASPALREGLTTASAEKSVGHLRALLGTPAAGLGDTSGLLAWDGLGAHHRSQLAGTIRQVAETGRTMIVDERTLVCDNSGCEVRQAIVSPLVVEATLVGALVVGAPHTTGGLVRAAAGRVGRRQHAARRVGVGVGLEPLGHLASVARAPRRLLGQ